MNYETEGATGTAAQKPGNNSSGFTGGSSGNSQASKLFGGGGEDENEEDERFQALCDNCDWSRRIDIKYVVCIQCEWRFNKLEDPQGLICMCQKYGLCFACSQSKGIQVISKENEVGGTKSKSQKPQLEEIFRHSLQLFQVTQDGLQETLAFVFECVQQIGLKQVLKDQLEQITLKQKKFSAEAQQLMRNYLYELAFMLIESETQSQEVTRRILDQFKDFENKEKKLLKTIGKQEGYALYKFEQIIFVQKLLNSLSGGQSEGFVNSFEGYRDLHVMVRRLLKFLIKEFTEKRKEFRELDLGFKLINRLGTDIPELVDQSSAHLRELGQILVEDLELYSQVFGNRIRTEEEGEFVIKQCVYIIKCLQKSLDWSQFWSFLQTCENIMRSPSLEIIHAFEFLFQNLFSSEFPLESILNNIPFLEVNDRVGGKEKYTKFERGRSQPKKGSQPLDFIPTLLSMTPFSWSNIFFELSNYFFFLIPPPPPPHHLNRFDQHAYQGEVPGRLPQFPAAAAGREIEEPQPETEPDGEPAEDDRLSRQPVLDLAREAVHFQLRG